MPTTEDVVTIMKFFWEGLRGDGAEKLRYAIPQCYAGKCHDKNQLQPYFSKV